MFLLSVARPLLYQEVLPYEENVLQNDNDYRTNGFGNLKYAMGNFKRYLRRLYPLHWSRLLLDRCDTSWILAGDDILNLTWKCQLFLVDNFIALNDIDGNVVIDIT